ncbi:hypothetical protein FRC07_005715 [Ceratobasidium sp. 392]|nr:hypothetical protein FRC07_005715 [Ceratobasidium sp. 392]
MHRIRDAPSAEFDNAKMQIISTETAADVPINMPPAAGPRSKKPKRTRGKKTSSDPKVRKRQFRFDPRVPNGQLRAWKTEVRRDVREAMENPLILEDYSFAAHQHLADTWKQPKPEHESWRGGSERHLDGDHAQFVIGHDESVGLLYIPGFVSGPSLAKFSDSTETHMQMELPAPPVAPPDPASASALPDKNSANVQAASVRHCPCQESARNQSTQARSASSMRPADHDPSVARPVPGRGRANSLPTSAQGRRVPARHTEEVNRFDLGKAGDVHFGIWHAQGHQATFSSEPTRDTVKNSSTMQWSSWMQFLDSNHPVDHRVNYLTEITRPDLFEKLCTSIEGAAEHPGFKPLTSVWHSVYPGRAVIVNRQTGEHLDKNGLRRGWDVIIAGGEFTGGEFYLRDMNLRCPFRPGDLVAFDGTAQRHKIEKFEGRIRLSHVYFVHESVLTEQGIATDLEDLYLSDIVDRMAQFTRVQGPKLPPGSVGEKRPASEDDLGSRAVGSKRA